MKNLLIILALFFLGSTSNEESMTWNESAKLTWADFKATPNLESDAVALTASGITFGYSVNTSGERIVDFSTSVEAHFYPSKSWYIQDKGNAYILAHEQLHFDITELYARKFRAQIKKLVVNQNVKDQMNRLHAKINEAVNETQKRYDAQTNHSMNREMQKEWEITIQKELREFEDYKSL
ncbi:DUF922 domain-containing protein [Winogradskyella thalassocola]|uniref:DUF922 domain-containing protein n=1 Tax=Winogradskyella thalassocola TaxID=262004 RepID=A0A1G8H9W7_9FLAO|nr:DUF922 domain-containing protein [Winogradskyella thalassocola]SDI03423.1 protein of unknown function [Winogradskyella thalassocola]